MEGLRQPQTGPDRGGYVSRKYSGFKVLQGDGYAGTIIQVFFAPGVKGPRSYKEEFLVVDDVKRVKVGKFIEGGPLKQGFARYVVTLEGIEKEKEKEKEEICIMRGSIDYKLYDEAAIPSVAASIDGLLDIMHAVADYVANNRN